MHLFGYGSLMNITSLRKTVPEATITGTDYLKGYRRVFDLRSTGRSNGDVRSCVLNLIEDQATTVCGILISIPEESLAALIEREKQYDLRTVQLESGTEAITFIACNYEVYPYQHGDPKQEEYLRLCISAATEYDFLKNLLNTTYIDGKTLHELGMTS